MKNFKNFPLIMMINKNLINLPTPININYWWNYGSMLGLCLLTQIITGLFLSFHYCPNIYEAFNSVIHINNNINYGWFIHYLHMNMASFFFFCIYIHIGRNLYYNTFTNFLTWQSGVIILFILMATAFLGYVLPWGQMSFWGSMVITNLISALPYIGETITKWIWGSFSISNPTLNRFYSLHFLLPFILIFFIFMHLFFLHNKGSNNPLGLNSELYKINFNNYFTIKDSLTFLMIIFFLILMILMKPFILGDPENFNPANSLNTPIHIQPEWYFLFAYSILRSIPNKLGGVMSLIFSILILSIIPLYNLNIIKSNSFLSINKKLFWLFTNIFITLTIMGSYPIENPFISLSQIMTILYFSFFLIIPLINYKFNELLNI